MKKRFMMSLLTVILCMGLFTGTAFAYSGEEVTMEAESESQEPETVQMKPLTPDGNLTLIDDEGQHSSAGKQFITMVTKSGNYFYLIIDRDEDGKEAVHFLNQVDEEDLFALMEEEEVEKIKEDLAGKEEPLPTEPETTTAEIIEPEPELEESESINWGPTIIVIVIFGGIGAAVAYMKLKEGKKKKESRTNPDKEFVDDYSDELEELDDDAWTEDDNQV